MAARDIDEMLEELGGHALVGGFSFDSSRAMRIRFRQNMPIQPVASDCTSRSHARRRAAVDECDIVQPEKAALEQIVAERVDLVDPPGKVDSSLWKQFSRNAVGLAGADRVLSIDAPDGPGMDRRVQVGEFPFVGGDLAVGVLELLEEHEPELFLGVLDVDQR